MQWHDPIVQILGLGIAAVVFGSAILVMRFRSCCRAEATVEVPENCLESSLTYRRMLAAAAWSKGARQSCDRTVRPVLTDLAASVGLEHCHGPGASEPGRAELVRWVRAIEEATPSHDPRDRL